MSGLILPDVPYEEKEEFDVILKKYGLDLISMIAPTSHQRIPVFRGLHHECLEAILRKS